MNGLGGRLGGKICTSALTKCDVTYMLLGDLHTKIHWFLEYRFTYGSALDHVPRLGSDYCYNDG